MTGWKAFRAITFARVPGILVARSSSSSTSSSSSSQSVTGKSASGKSKRPFDALDRWSQTMSSKTLELDRMGTWNNLGDEEEICLPELEQEESARRGTLVSKVVGPDTKVGVCISRGRRISQEDRFVVADLTSAIMTSSPAGRRTRGHVPSLLLMAVFDGHGGPECADFCAKNVTGLIVNRHGSSLMDGGDPAHILSEVLTDLDRNFVDHWIKDLKPQGRRKAQSSPADGGAAPRLRLCPGSTATLALIRDDYELSVAHVGDSRAILCRIPNEEKGGSRSATMVASAASARRLTMEHDTSDETERHRIEAAGGIVTYDEIGRHMVNGRLAMSRSLGDLELKEYGVSSEPQVLRRSIHHYRDAALVLVTDGVTFVMNDEEVAACVRRCDNPRDAAARIVDQALMNACEDNCTALVLPLGAWTKSKTPTNKKASAMEDSGITLGRSMSLSPRFS